MTDTVTEISGEEAVQTMSNSEIEAAFFELVRGRSSLLEEPIGTAVGPTGEMTPKETAFVVKAVRRALASQT
jgi:hypothetical protein